jgi:type IV pilus assembly protein PilB
MRQNDSLDLKRVYIDPSILSDIPLSMVERHQVIPVRKEGDTLVVASSSPEDTELKAQLEAETGISISLVYAEAADIKAAILSKLKIKTIFGSLEEPDYAEFESIHRTAHRRDIDPNVLSHLPDAPNIPDLLDLILYHAITHGASDIHLDPGPAAIFVRMRIDGMLHIFQQLPLTFLSPLISTIKVYAGMDIAETRLPQDGQVSVCILESSGDDEQNPEIDIRVASISTVYGEKVTMRILDANKMDLTIASLGFSDDQRDVIERLSHSPQGMFLVTGPTGSGKTTTLFSILNQIKGYTNNIVTVEDPVEYRLSWLNQVEVNEKIGLTFANACRSFLRLDPDVILVGEIRDHETAHIAVQNALVGRLLLSTLHSNSAVGAIQRLISLGLPPFWISATLTAVLGQRLARTICDACITSYKPPTLLLKQLDLPIGKTYYHGKGCDLCLNTGYLGRTVISELFLIDDKLRKLIESDATEMQLLMLAEQQGFKSFLYDAAQKVLSKKTTVEEVSRILNIQ